LFCSIQQQVQFVFYKNAKTDFGFFSLCINILDFSKYVL
jgi:hypothetical protein